jgi:hypothetical protein
MGAGTCFTVEILVTKWYKGVEGLTKPHKAKPSQRHKASPTRTCNQSSQSMAPAGHEVTAEEPAGQ